MYFLARVVLRPLSQIFFKKIETLKIKKEQNQSLNLK